MATFPRTKDAEAFPPLASGWYKLRVVEVHDKTDRNQNPYWAVQFEVLEHEPKQVWDNFRNDESWLWKLKNFLECINPDLTEEEFEAEKIYGQQVMAYVVPEKQGERTWDRIKDYAPIDSPQPTVPPNEGGFPE